MCALAGAGAPAPWDIRSVWPFTGRLGCCGRERTGPRDNATVVARPRSSLEFGGFPASGAERGRFEQLLDVRQDLREVVRLGDEPVGAHLQRQRLVSLL